MIAFVFGILFGIFAAIAVAYFILFNPLGTPSYSITFSDQFQPLRIAPELSRFLRSNDGGSGSKSESCFSLSLILHFLYQEYKDTRRFRRWFHKRLQLELNDLTTRSAAGRLIQDVRIRDLCVGSQFPVISNVRVESYAMCADKEGFECLNLLIDVNYDGGFQASVDVSMLFGRFAQLSVKVTHLSGKARLTLTREPFTHWTFAFVEMPKLDFKIESQWQGKPLKHVIPLITQQFRRIVHRKHVWPNYKIRYRPFFPNPLLMPTAPIGAFNHIDSVGGLEVTVLKCSRLNASLASLDHSEVYCTLTIEQRPFLHSSSPNSVHCVTVLLNFTRYGLADPLGLTFSKSVAELGLRAVQVSAVQAGSSAEKSGFKIGDTILAVNNVPIQNERQAAKFLCGTVGELNVLVERNLSEFNASQNELFGVDPEDVLVKHGVDDEGYLMIGGADMMKNAVQSPKLPNEESLDTETTKISRKRSQSTSKIGCTKLLDEQLDSVESGGSDIHYSHSVLSGSAPAALRIPVRTPTVLRVSSDRFATSEHSETISSEIRKAKSEAELSESRSCNLKAGKSGSDSNPPHSQNASASPTSSKDDAELSSLLTVQLGMPASTSFGILHSDIGPQSSIDRSAESDALTLHEETFKDKERPPSRRERIQARAAEMAAAGKARVSDLWYRKKDVSPQVEVAAEAVLGEEPTEGAFLNAEPVHKVNSSSERTEKKRISSKEKIKGSRQTSSPGKESSSDKSEPPQDAATNGDKVMHSRSTRHLQLCENVLWGQSLHFVLDKKSSRYLNVTIHSCSKIRKDEPQPGEVDASINEQSRPVMLGYTSIFVPQIIDDCQLTLSNCHQEVFTLRPPLSPIPKRGMPSCIEETSRHPGFDARLCYGDILLGFRYFPDGLPQGVGLNPELDVSTDDELESEDSASLREVEETGNAPVASSFAAPQLLGHNFQPVTLKSGAPVCAVCHGKVWFKSATRCTRCIMVCHNKCVQKVGSAKLICTPNEEFDDTNFEVLDSNVLSSLDGPSFLDDTVGTMGSAAEVLSASTVQVVDVCSGMDEHPQTRRRRIAEKLSEKLSTTWSRMGRKKPIRADEHLEAQQTLEPIQSALNEAALHRPIVSVESIIPDVFAELEISGALCNMKYQPGNAYNEEMINAAKDVGKNIFVDMEHSARKIKINEQVDRIQCAINKTTAERLNALEEWKGTSVTESSEFSALDDRLQALAVLMLHYCAALQDCIDREEGQQESSSNIESISSAMQFALKSNLGIVDTSNPRSDGVLVSDFPNVNLENAELTTKNANSL